MDNIKEILEFLHKAENLKKELRHSWLSDGRQESVAEHTWRLALMALLLEPSLKNKINIEQVLKMIIIHDIAEAEIGDIPAFIKDESKAAKEKKAMLKIKKELGAKGDEIYGLWAEYEECKTDEARFVKALDKLEVRMQHNEADLGTWNSIEHPRSQYIPDRYCEHEESLKILNELIKKEALEKMEKAGVDIKKVLEEAEELRKKQ